MSVVIVGGNECMVKRYEDLCKSYSCKAKVFVKQDRGIQNFGNPDLMHKKTELLTVLTDIFSPDTAADGLEICPILPSPSFLSRQKSVPLKLRAPKTDYFCPRFVEDDAGIPGVFQGGRNGISAKRTAFGVRVRFSYAYSFLYRYNVAQNA